MRYGVVIINKGGHKIVAKSDKANKRREQVPRREDEEEARGGVVPGEDEGAGAPKEEEQLKRKSYYNPVTAKAYRERLMEAAKAGGYEPKPRAAGTGASEKRTSKKGTTYYYTPWSSLTEEQKATRLAQARTRAKTERELAARYKAEHPEEFSGGVSDDGQ